jgi:hypothetical protein
MAEVDIGRALSGLGAAFKNEMPAFIQQVRQEDLDAERLADREMALTERRKKTMFQDMAAAKILFDAGDYRGIADLMEDRVNLLRNTDADTSHSRNYGSLAVRAAAGDPQAISELGGGIQNGVAVGYATGMIPMPVDRSTTLKEGDVVFNRDGSIRHDNRVPEEPKQGKDERGVLRYETGPRAGQPVYGSGASSVPTSGVLPSSIPAAIRRPNLQTVEERGKYADLSPFDRDRLMREDALAEQADADRLAGLERDRLSDERLTSSLIIPDVLIADLDEDVAALAAAAYRGGNGGSSGMAAASKVIEDSRELSRMENMAVSLSEIFPSARGAEMEELQSIVRNAESYEKGMELAQVRRESQKMDSAGRENKLRGLQLIDRIIANKDLNAVLGSMEGRHEIGDLAHRWDPQETNAIADINNLRDILTGDNLGMMTGVLSESDMRIIANIAGGGLERQRDEETFMVDIQKIREALARDFDPDSAPVVTSTTVTPRTSTGTPALQSQADSIIRGDG